MSCCLDEYEHAGIQVPVAKITDHHMDLVNEFIIRHCPAIMIFCPEV